MKKILSLVSALLILSLTACGNNQKVSELSTQEVQKEQDVIEPNLETEPVAENIQKQQEETKPSESVISEKHNQDATVDLYVNVLRNYISEGKTDFSVSFIDINDDSTKEMVVFFGESQMDGASIFTVRNEEVVQVVAEGIDSFGQYGGFTYKEKGNVFIAEYEFATETQISSQIFYYVLEDGKAICENKTQSTAQFDSDESEFFVNDTKVEKEEFYSIEENYGLLEMTTVSYSDGVRVINGQMDMVYNAYDNE